MFRCAGKVAKSDYSFRHACSCVRPSAWRNSFPTRRIFTKFYNRDSFENLSRKFKFLSNLTSVMATLHDDLCTIMTISRWILLNMRNISDKSSGESRTNILRSVTFSENRAVYEIMLISIAEQDMPQVTIWRTRFTCWITMATHTRTIFNNYCFSTATSVL
jgi:hypothetical protein